MATIAELLVEIKAKDSNLKRGLTKATSRIKNFAKKVGKRLAIIGTLVAAAVIAAAAKIAGVIRRTADEIDKLAKTSKKLGVGVEELQKLQFQAKLSGVSVETFNMALQRLVRRVAEAGMGTGEAVGALKELGIDAKELSKLSPDKQFTKIAKAMRLIANQGDKVRLAMKLFDSEGVALVNTLGLNLDKTGKEFEELGIAISASQAKAVEAFNDASVKLETIWDGLFMQITASVAPALESLVVKVIEFIKASGGVEPIARRIGSVMISSISGIIKAMSALINIVNLAISAFNKLSRAGQGIKLVGQAVGLAAKKLNPFASKESVLKKEDALGKTVDALSVGGSAAGKVDVSSITTSLDKLSATIAKQAEEVTAQKQKPAAASAVSGFGSISDPRTGRSVSVGTPQKVDVQIIADKDKLVNAVVTSDQFKDQVQAETNKTTKDAARATRR